MGKFNRGDRSGGGGRGKPEMHRATCADCGKSCEVPFRPTGDKPVYCSYCFGEREDSGGNRNDRGGNRNDRGSNNRNDRYERREKQMFDAVCDECNEKCQVPFRPSPDKPIYCSDCFGQDERGVRRDNDRKQTPKSAPVQNSDQNNKQFEALNRKLDKIMEMLSRHASVSKKQTVVKEVKEEKAAEVAEKKVVEKKETTKKAVAKEKTAEPTKTAKKIAKKVAVKEKAVAKKKVVKKTATKKKK